MIAIVGLGVLGTRVLKLLSEYEEVYLIDYDIVEEKNIRRQYPPAAVGMRKVDAARKFLRPNARILHKHLDWSTIGVLRDMELVIDCTDNMLARYVINDYCAKFGIPWLHVAVSDAAGSVVAMNPGGPCYQCVYPRGIGEACTQLLDLQVADKTAEHAIAELVRLRAENQPRFVRITSATSSALTMKRRNGCLTCSGEFHYLQPQDYYITFCTSAGCMSAKPVKPQRHDSGVGEQTKVQGTAITVYPNGEIHFGSHLNDDALREIAEHVYDTRFRRSR